MRRCTDTATKGCSTPALADVLSLTGDGASVTRVTGDFVAGINDRRGIRGDKEPVGLVELPEAF